MAKKEEDLLTKKLEEKGFQERHRQAREEVRAYILELNGKYKEKKGYAFLRFLEDRMKTAESVVHKLERKDLPVNFETAVEKLNDISGVRVICYCVDDIYWIAKQIARDQKFEIVKFKDFIMKPKKCGYQSYHIILEVPVGKKGQDTESQEILTGNTVQGKVQQEKQKPQATESVRVELQIRTMAMDAWAGLDNQIRYKKEKEISKEMQKEITKYSRLVTKLDRMIADIRKENFT